jgi:hypothetical protein
MAANKQQGSYLTLFWTACTVLCAGIAYFAEGFGKLVFLIGLAGVVISLIGFVQIKTLEGKTANPATIPALKALGIVVNLGGWFITISGLHLTTSVAGRLVFALVGIGISLIAVLGVLPVAFGRKVAGKAQSPSFMKTTMEHSR